jgi:hypothetical protein
MGTIRALVGDHRRIDASCDGANPAGPSFFEIAPKKESSLTPARTATGTPLRRL